jgi:hypothetical protein
MDRLYISAQVLSPYQLCLNSYQGQAIYLATFSIQAFEGKGDAFHK